MSKLNDLLSELQIIDEMIVKYEKSEDAEKQNKAEAYKEELDRIFKRYAGAVYFDETEDAVGKYTYKLENLGKALFSGDELEQEYGLALFREVDDIL